MHRWIAGWLALALAGAAPALSAQAVYRCDGADGAITFQDHACAAGQRQREVVIVAAPAWTPSPSYRVADPAPARRHRPRTRTARAEPLSWQCRASNGEVFHRHARCPATLRGAAGTATLKVTAKPITRRAACRAIERGHQRGHERDERVSSYQRNLGQDPCRWL
ncbi:MAG: DUF4124 domain-containing protein [Dokdonella sp.]|nr:MAG: DUF4124 domain-containing protein [Dokdonella sp.]